MEGANSREGRVEVCRNNAWGTVCDNGWGKPDATVVCRQLDLSITAAVATTHASFFGQGTGPINLVNVNCVGTESRLIDCPRGSQTLCSHSEDAGVRCSAQTGELPYYELVMSSNNI